MEFKKMRFLLVLSDRTEEDLTISKMEVSLEVLMASAEAEEAVEVVEDGEEEEEVFKRISVEDLTWDSEAEADLAVDLETKEVGMRAKGNAELDSKTILMTASEDEVVAEVSGVVEVNEEEAHLVPLVTGIRTVTGR